MSESKMLRFKVGEDGVDRISVATPGTAERPSDTHAIRFSDIRSVGTLAMWVRVTTTYERVDIRITSRPWPRSEIRS